MGPYVAFIVRSPTTTTAIVRLPEGTMHARKEMKEQEKKKWREEK
jgi:hypothetical protein